MRYQTATAYACVAYRTMEKDGMPMTEENMELIIGILYDFYSEQEIEKIYRDNICFDSYQMIMDDKEIKNKIVTCKTEEELINTINSIEDALN